MIFETPLFHEKFGKLGGRNKGGLVKDFWASFFLSKMIYYNNKLGIVGGSREVLKMIFESPPFYFQDSFWCSEN